MPTLEEELEALKSALSLLQTRHISDIQQLGERITSLQQQIEEQKRRTSEQGQRTTTLEKALSQQFAVMGQSFLHLEQQIEQQTLALKQKFEASDHFAGRTWGLAQEQERDIREIKISIRSIDDRFTSLERRSESQDKKLDALEQNVNSRFEGQDKKLDDILALLKSGRSDS
jgi:chromosome segregation ATPase